MSTHPFKTEQEWERIEAPLRTLDEFLAEYASANGFVFSENYKFWPERSLRWNDGLERQMQVILTDENNLLYSVWIMAFEDRRDGRYWKRQILANKLPIHDIQVSLARLLDEGLRVVTAWSADELIRGKV